MFIGFDFYQNNASLHESYTSLKGQRIAGSYCFRACNFLPTSSLAI